MDSLLYLCKQIASPPHIQEMLPQNLPGAKIFFLIFKFKCIKIFSYACQCTRHWGSNDKGTLALCLSVSQQGVRRDCYNTVRSLGLEGHLIPRIEMGGHTYTLGVF